MKFGAMTLSILAGSLLLSPLALSAQPGAGMEKGKRMEKMFADLNLTADQKAKLKTLHQELKGSHQQVFDQMKELREKTKAELQKPQPSKEALDGYASRTGDLHKQLAQKRTDHLLQVKALLTPEQFTKLLNREARCQGCKGGKGGKCGHKGKRGCEGHGPGGAQEEK